jgi:uncharacterized protein
MPNSAPTSTRSSASWELSTHSAPSPIRALLVALLLAGAAVARAADPPIPKPDGFVTDRAGVIGPEVGARITQLAEALRAKTGAELAVLTVRSTLPLDDFTYAMRVADAWGVGKGGEDTGVLLLVATDDRKIRVLTGYGLEGILPDGLVGAIQDDEMLPSFREGRLDEGIWRGVAAIAGRIATARGVSLDGLPPPRQRLPQPERVPLPGWAFVLFILLVCVALWLSSKMPRGRRGGFGGFPGGWSGGGGGFGGMGHGGFGGFGGGRFGGGGAGRSW